MKENRLGTFVLGAALVLGVAGDNILRVGPWGLNILVWIGLFVLTILFLERSTNTELMRKNLWTFLAILFFGMLFAWRDSLTLKFLALCSLLAALIILTLQRHTAPLRLMSILQYAIEAIATALSAVFGPVILFLNDIEWDKLRGNRATTLAVVRGLILALPFVVLFGSLFAAADAVFENFVDKVFSVDLKEFFSHLFFIGLFGWITAGYLRRLLLQSEFSASQFQFRRRTSLGIIEVGVILGALNVLFLLFVVVQIRYLFGGSEFVSATESMTYSQYARRGFFELVAVSALVLPILLGAHWLLNKDKAMYEKIFRWLAMGLILTLFVIMASAVQRMLMYQREYGLTELRLYPTAFMAWLATVFVWFSLTVLRGLRERFAFGSLLAALAFVAGLHVLNPDGLIARVNIQRALEGKSLDPRYLTSLSADAVPTLVESLRTLNEKDRALIAEQLSRRWTVLERGDWRTWSVARSSALRSIRGYQANNEVIGAR